jgi:hypothetical protein
MSLLMQPPTGSKEIGCVARRVFPFAIHTQAWSRPRVEGLHSNSSPLFACWPAPRPTHTQSRPNDHSFQHQVTTPMPTRTYSCGACLFC